MVAQRFQILAQNGQALAVRQIPQDLTEAAAIRARRQLASAREPAHFGNHHRRSFQKGGNPSGYRRAPAVQSVLISRDGPS